jgi:hypothetical protein
MADPLAVLFRTNPGRRISIGGIVVDATLEELHEYNATVTQHPIEEGGFVTDHVYENPRKVRIKGEITDSPVVFFSVLGGVSNRRIEAYDQLLALYQTNDIVTIVTGLKIYNDMVIQALSFPRDPATGERLNFVIELEQIKKVASQIVGIAEQNAAPEIKDKVSDNKDIGRKETQELTDSQEQKAEKNSSLLRNVVRAL